MDNLLKKVTILTKLEWIPLQIGSANHPKSNWSPLSEASISSKEFVNGSNQSVFKEIPIIPFYF